MISHAYVRSVPDENLRRLARAAIVTHSGSRRGIAHFRAGELSGALDLSRHPWVAGPQGCRSLVSVAGEAIAWTTNDGAVHVGFDWWAFERDALLERSRPDTQPIYSRGAIPYDAIPFGLRTQLNRIRIGLLRARSTDTGFPSAPVETSVDTFRDIVWSAACKVNGVEVREPHGRTLVLTHDLDESAGWPGVARLRAVERRFGVRSAFGVLSHTYRLDEVQLQDLVGEGCEIYSHGHSHDGKLPYLADVEIDRQLRQFFVAYPSMRGVVRGFRAPQLARSPRLYRRVGEVFEYDMTPPTVELGGPHGWRTGCATTLPFTDEYGLAHLPLTLPQDYFLTFIERLRPHEVTAAWLAAAELVWSVGGVAVHLIHPDNVVRRRTLLRAYSDFLEAALSDGAEVCVPAEVMTKRGVIT